MTRLLKTLAASIPVVIACVMAVILVFAALPPHAHAAEEPCQQHPLAQCCTRTEDNCGQLEYVGNVEVSAYWPHEDSYTNNYKGAPLTSLVGDIVAAPTGSPLLGKTLAIVTGDGGVLIRTVADTGCKRGRLDLLVEDSGEMHAWGLVPCDVWILEEATE